MINNLLAATISILLLAIPGLAQTMTAEPNNLSLRIGDDPTEIILKSNGTPVSGVQCEVPRSSARVLTFKQSTSGADGKISVIAKAPSEGLVVVCTGDGGLFANVYITEIKIRTTGTICGDLDDLKTDADRILFFAKMVPPMTADQINKTLSECEKGRIITSPTILDYRTVRDNYGKGIGDSFVVVQINVSNRSDGSKFYLQNAQIALDPNRCSAAADYFGEIYYVNKDRLKSSSDSIQIATPKDTAELREIQTQVALENENVKILKAQFLNKCIDQFLTHFQYPIALSAISRDKVMGVANANLYRSPRRIGFQIANFVSAMNPVLTGLKFLGRDGKLGFGFLGTTILPEADKGIPNISNDKMKLLEGAMKTGEIIIDPGKSEMINIFVESRYFFSAETFSHYKLSAKKATDESLAFTRLLKLFLVSSVDGILIANDSPKVVSKPGSGLPDPSAFPKP